MAGRGCKNHRCRDMRLLFSKESFMHVKRESNQCFAIEHTLVLLLHLSARILASVVVARLDPKLPIEKASVL